MKKLKTVMLVVLLVVAMLMGQASVFAVTPVTVQSTDEPHAIEVTRKISDVTNPVTNTFTYSVTADSSNPATVTGAPTSFTIDFNAVQPDGENVAAQTGAIDFTGATFSKVGDYKFLVKETASTDSTTYPVDDSEYYVYVQVRNEVDENGVPTGNLVATVLTQGTEVGDATNTKKPVEFPAESVFTNMTLTKEVEGNMADPNEYFKFKIEIEGGLDGDTYVISGQDATVDYEGASINTSSTYTVGQDNYVYLKAGQTVTIGKTDDDLNQIKVGSTYTITEEGATSYETYINGSTADSKVSEELVAEEDATQNENTFVNKKEEANLTGLFISVTPYIVILAVAALGIVLLVKSKKKNEEI